MTTFPTIDLATKYWIKGFGFTVARLLHSESLANDFNGGGIVIARLAPQDYHRWHSPVSGTVESIVEIPGAYYTVNPQAITQQGSLDVFCENRRSVMIVRRRSTGKKVAIIAVGAMLGMSSRYTLLTTRKLLTHDCVVGSIRYNPGVEVGAEIHRGQCLGAFRYGGSTVINLYEPADVRLDPDLVDNSTKDVCETLVRVGERVGASPETRSYAQ